MMNESKDVNKEQIKIELRRKKEEIKQKAQRIENAFKALKQQSGS
ncbi:hypothetical protein [Gallaecimonas xiamenensis]|nr:hypothetical protein [Gallaecimonas xiamenensis]